MMIVKDSGKCLQAIQITSKYRGALREDSVTKLRGPASIQASSNQLLIDTQRLFRLPDKI